MNKNKRSNTLEIDKKKNKMIVRKKDQSFNVYLK